MTIDRDDSNGLRHQLDDQRYPPELSAAEAKRVGARRASPGHGEPKHPWVGTGLSGGGIRSATFCLGVFQGLARARLLRKIDFLSTVSGGGYFGGFFGALFCRPSVGSSADAEAVLREEKDPDVVGHLRENGRYLSPNGSGDLLLAGGAMLRNWVALQIVILSLLFLAAALVRWLSLAAQCYLPLPAWTAGGPFSWSPWMLAAVIIFVLWVFPAGWSYWFVGEGPWVWAGMVVVVLFAPVILFVPAARAALPHPEGLALLAAALPLITLLMVAAAKQRTRREGEISPAAALLSERNLTSRYLKMGLLIFAALLAIALVDTLGGLAYSSLWMKASRFIPALGSVSAVLSLLAGLGGKVAKTLSKDGKRPSIPIDVVATSAALLLAAAVLVALSALTHGFAWDWQRPAEAPAGVLWPAGGLLAAGAVALLFSFLYAHVPSFVNRSTQLPLYASRLTRAYLGASNPERKTGEPLYHVLPHDDVPLHEYWDGRRQQHGAPLHIINVTVNETVDGRSQVQQQDRKGCPLALGPCGLSLGVRHHLALDWPSDAPLVEESREERDPTRFRVFRQAAGTFKGETLSLGAWMGISGAAFSTGLGYRTSLGLSLLTGIANVRLGYWWYPGQKGRKHPWLMYLFPVQGYILSELIARFPGTAWKRWYLSDGGHFENLGGYELIRRRLPRIVLVDAECDPDYTFSGLANLVRKARVDFDTDIDFKDDKELERLWQEEAGGIPEAERPPLGALSALRREEASEESRACAALADVVYDDGSRGRLLYVKAALCGKVPVDVREYHAKHPEFPHETTADQFFDEAQWESYRKLGSLVSSRLFGAGDDTPPSRGQAWLRDYLFA